jgi:hypothetical protein
MWKVLAFTDVDLRDEWRDACLAESCVCAWKRCGRPRGFLVLQTAGDGAHPVYWYLCERAAMLLDSEHVAWRSFMVGECEEPPEDAWSAIRYGASELFAGASRAARRSLRQGRTARR